MSRAEASSLAIQYANQRGYAARVKKAHLTGRDLWKVMLEVERRDAQGKLHLELDAFSRAVVRAQEHVKFKKDRPRKGRVHGASAVARR